LLVAWVKTAPDQLEWPLVLAALQPNCACPAVT
jgi:hypothetical protein